ncbi:MAG: hypothetical protein HPY52_11530 [Firmicutes bacterium]|nr:hypothetical protein [Bacillota bacterium]
MPSFTFTNDAANTGNQVLTATVSVAISPESAVLASPALLPGASVVGTVAVSNAGDVNCLYFISANWAAAGTTTASMAQILAGSLNVSVVASPPTTTIYTGALTGLVDQPSGGQSLPLGSVQEATFTLALSPDAGNLVQNQDLSIDFIFVATQA